MIAPISAMLAVFLVALFARSSHLRTAYDLFIDEVTYASIARSVADGDGVLLHGLPFTLHPPLGLLVDGAVLSVSSSGGDLLESVWLLRAVAGAWGSLGVVLLVAVLRAAGAGRAAWVGGLLAALSPFLISFDGRVMLEAQAQAFALAAVWFLLLASDFRAPRRIVLLVAAGLAAGGAAATKETFGMVLVLFLAVLLLRGWLLRRRELMVVLAVAAGVYAAFVGYLVVDFGFDVWWRARLSGLDRLVGIEQSTGFNEPGSQASLLGRFAANLPDYLTTYVLLAFGAAVAGVSVLRQLLHRRGLSAEPRDDRALALQLWCAVAATYLAYATLFGSLEEQMYAILLVPSIAVTCATGAALVRRHPYRPFALGVALTAVAAMGFDAGVWAHVRSTDHDAYAQLLHWMPTHVPPASVVAVTEDTAQFLLTGYTIGQWGDPVDVRAHGVDVVVLQTGLVQQGYGTATPELLAELESEATLVFDAPDATNGDLRVYDISGVVIQ